MAVYGIGPDCLANLGAALSLAVDVMMMNKSYFQFDFLITKETSKDYFKWLLYLMKRIEVKTK